MLILSYCNIYINSKQNILNTYLKYIPKLKAQKIINFKNPKRRAQSIAGELLLQYIFQTQLNFQSTLDYTYNKYGKPLLADSNFFFNISHSKDYVVCVFSDKEIGVDIEEISKPITVSNYHFFHPKEINVLNQNINLFYELWTSKEAFLKKIGTGLSRPLNTFYSDLSRDLIIDELNSSFCNIIFYNSIENYRMAICSDFKTIDKIIKIDIDTLLNFYSQKSLPHI